MTFICERSVPATHVLFSGLPVTPLVRTWLRVAGQISCGLKYRGREAVPFLRVLVGDLDWSCQDGPPDVPCLKCGWLDQGHLFIGGPPECQAPRWEWKEARSLALKTQGRAWGKVGDSSGRGRRKDQLWGLVSQRR